MADKSPKVVKKQTAKIETKAAAAPKETKAAVAAKPADAKKKNKK